MIDTHPTTDTLILVVHEIYGQNSHMMHVCQQLTAAGYAVLCPNLLERESPYEYAEEAEAYRSFMENVGFLRAAEKIKSVLREQKGRYARVFLVGYSVGATVSWLLSEEEGLAGIVGFYGSRIRNYPDQSPRCPALLFFPEEERSFDVDELIAQLSGREMVEVCQLAGRHGFSDPYSPAYEESSARLAHEKMLRFIL